jgi:hypothetical protein
MDRLGRFFLILGASVMLLTLVITYYGLWQSWLLYLSAVVLTGLTLALCWVYSTRTHWDLRRTAIIVANVLVLTALLWPKAGPISTGLCLTAVAVSFGSQVFLSARRRLARHKQ